MSLCHHSTQGLSHHPVQRTYQAVMCEVATNYDALFLSSHRAHQSKEDLDEKQGHETAAYWYGGFVLSILALIRKVQFTTVSCALSEFRTLSSVDCKPVLSRSQTVSLISSPRESRTARYFPFSDKAVCFWHPSLSVMYKCFVKNFLVVSQMSTFALSAENEETNRQSGEKEATGPNPISRGSSSTVPVSMFHSPALWPVVTKIPLLEVGAKYTP